MAFCSNLFNFIWLLTAIVAFIALVVISILVETTGSLTSHSIRDVERKYSLQISPAVWAFVVWAIVYIWQALWLLYVLMRFMFGHGNIFSALFYISFIMSSLAGIGLVFAWCTNHLLISAICLSLVAMFLFICLWISLSTLYGHKNMTNTSNNNHHHHHHLKTKTLNFLVDNGIAFYAAWALFGACYLWGLTMKYHWSLSDKFSSFMALSILAFILLIYGLLNIIFFSRFRHIWSPVFALAVGHAAMIARNGLTMNKPATIMVVALLGAVAIAYIIKRCCCCMHRQKHNNNNKTQAPGQEDLPNV